MSINAIVTDVAVRGNGSGYLVLRGDERGQGKLFFETSPSDVKMLTNIQIWGGADSILVGEMEIAKRISYTRIQFTVEALSEAVDSERKRRIRGNL